MREPADRTVIVVDDELDHALIVQHVLARLVPSATVQFVTDLAEVTGRLRTAPRGALVLADRRFGATDVFETLERAVRERPDLQIALLSASLDDADRDRALAAGAACAAEKPGSLAGWTELLGGLLGLEGGAGT